MQHHSGTVSVPHWSLWYEIWPVARNIFFWNVNMICTVWCRTSFQQTWI